MMAKDVIKSVAAKHGLQPNDILGRDRFGHFIAARRDVLCNDGYSERKKMRGREEWKRRRAKQ